MEREMGMKENSDTYFDITKNIFSYVGARNIKIKYKLSNTDFTKKDKMILNLVHNIPAAVVCLRQDGTICYVNPRFTEVFGYHLEDISCGRTWLSEAVSAACGNRSADTPCRDSCRTQISEIDMRRSFRITCRDRTKKTAMLTVLLQTSGGYIISLNEQCPCSCSNLESLYAVSKPTLCKEIVENINEMIYSIDIEGYLNYASPAAKTILGYDPSELIGKSILDLVVEDDLATHQEDLLQTLSDDIVSEEYRVLTKSGEIIWIQDSRRPIFNQGMVTGAQGVVIDITEKKKYEKSLEFSEERYQDLVENLNDIIYSIDDKGFFSYVSPAVKNVAGFDPSEVIGRHFSEFVLREDLPVLLEGNRKTLCGDTGLEELKGRTKSGEFKWLQASGRPVFKGGKIVGVQGVIRDITKIKMAEEALMLSESRFKAIYELSPIGIILFNSELKLIHANRAALDIFRVKSIDETLIGSLLNKASLSDETRKNLLGGKTIRYESIFDFNELGVMEYLKTSKSEKVYVYVIATPIYLDGLLNPSNYIMQVQDITERKRAEAQIIASESKFAETFHLSPNPLALTEIGSGKIVDTNESFEELTGYFKEELIGHSTLEMDIWAEPNERKHLLKFLTDSERVQDMPMKMRRKNGEIRDLIMSARYIHLADKLHLITQARDVTEINRAAEELRRSQAKYKAIVEDLPNMLCRFKQDGILTYANEEYCSCFGKSKEESIGCSFLFSLTEMERKKLMNCIASLCTSKPVVSHEFMVNGPDGKGRWYRWTIRALFDEYENVIEYQSIGEDITESVHAREALVRAKHAAETTAHAKSEFLANMSHEIRTPLNAILGMTSILLDSNLNAEQKATLDALHNGGETLMAAINNILDFSKIESGKRELEMQPFSLKRCIHEALEIIEAKAKEKGILLNVSIDEDVPENVIGDNTCLRQVLLNILGNAIKFTDDGQVVLSACKCHPSDRSELKFCVKDTGIGISEDGIKRLFKPFSQVDASLTRRYGGTGLGLAISKRLVELMGGRIWAESELGKGSIFHFTITTEPVYAQKAIQMIESKQNAPRSLNDLQVILAEDNPINQRIMLHMLKKIGIQADVAANGLEVLRALDHKSYDIVLMDVAMPEMDGLEATKAIRQRYSNQPYIIAATAHTMDSDKEKCLACGMNDYISKPISIEVLTSALNRYLAANQSVSGNLHGPHGMQC
jgi:PAS domain S-box-containing protein